LSPALRETGCGAVPHGFRTVTTGYIPLVIVLNPWGGHGRSRLAEPVAHPEG